jgi:hypothetical protein
MFLSEKLPPPEYPTLMALPKLRFATILSGCKVFGVEILNEGFRHPLAFATHTTYCRPNPTQCPLTRMITGFHSVATLSAKLVSAQPLSPLTAAAPLRGKSFLLRGKRGASANADSTAGIARGAGS